MPCESAASSIFCHPCPDDTGNAVQIVDDAGLGALHALGQQRAHRVRLTRADFEIDASAGIEMLRRVGGDAPIELQPVAAAR